MLYCPWAARPQGLVKDDVLHRATTRSTAAAPSPKKQKPTETYPSGDTSLPPPKQPIYFAERNYGTDGAAEAIVNSANTMSVTTLEGR